MTNDRDITETLIDRIRTMIWYGLSPEEIVAKLPGISMEEIYLAYKAAKILIAAEEKNLKPTREMRVVKPNKV